MTIRREGVLKIKDMMPWRGGAADVLSVMPTVGDLREKEEKTEKNK